MVRATLLVLLLFAACVRTTAPAHPQPPRKQASTTKKKSPPKKKPKKTAKKTPKKAAALPAGFQVKAPVKPKEPFLKPEAMWRFVLSHLTTLRADARARNEDILVSFQADTVHVTDRAGRRRSWKLPKGLRLRRVPAHVLLGADLSTTVFGPDGAQIPGAEEITVIEARIEVADGNVEIFRLVVKGGQGFRSISSHG